MIIVRSQVVPDEQASKHAATLAVSRLPVFVVLREFRHNFVACGRKSHRSEAKCLCRSDRVMDLVTSTHVSIILFRIGDAAGLCFVEPLNDC